MNASVDICPEALSDLEAAADWYDERMPGLGAEYVSAMCVAIRSLTEGAYHYPLRNRRLRVRWLCTRRFPYRIIYRLDGERVTVLAILHTARHDREWRRRIY
jgi:plasmid stabilization system protein ParE